MAYNPFPSLNEQYISNGIVYVWNGSDWIETKNLNYSFNQIQINKADKFDSFITRNINFEGINLSIYSADSNTIVFSAQQQTNSSSTFSGGTVSGATNFTNGLSANIISATTYQNVNAVTGGSYSNGTITLSGTGNVNGTQITGLPTSSSSFTGGTITGPTNFTSGLTATTISATTYQGLPFLITYRRLTSSSTLDSTDLSTVNSGNPLVIEMNVSSGNTITVPPNSAVTFSIGSQITISQYGTGQTTIVAGLGVTLRSSGNFLKLAAQYSMATLMKVGTNEWYVVGQLSP
jgi:hypothetical protein